jgi:alkylated DNA repair dioxygenase AlkB
MKNRFIYMDFMSEAQYLIPGLKYVAQYISQEEHNGLTEAIDKQPWINDLKRRVQHYGYRYDYKRRSVSSDMKLGALPSWAQDFAKKFQVDELADFSPNQVIVNEYYPGQGISKHIDCIPCFGAIIVSLSLSSSCVMEFINIKSKEKRAIFLQPRSLLVMSGDARYRWQHLIPARKKDLYNGEEKSRSRRISITFREVLL